MTKMKSIAMAVAMAALMAGSAVSTASAQNHHGDTPARDFLRQKALRHSMHRRPMMRHHRSHYHRMMRHPRTM